MPGFSFTPLHLLALASCHPPDCAVVFLPVHRLFTQPEGTSPLPSLPCPDVAVGTLAALCSCLACGVRPVAVTSERRDVASVSHRPGSVSGRGAAQLPVSFCPLLLTGRLWDEPRSVSRAFGRISFPGKSRPFGLCHPPAFPSRRETKYLGVGSLESLADRSLGSSGPQVAVQVPTSWGECGK